MVGLGSYADMVSEQRATDGTHGTPRAQMDPCRPSEFGGPTPLQKAGLVAREVYWQFLKPLSGNSKNTMVGMRLIFPGAANAF
jgi:hypothetical protein